MLLLPLAAIGSVSGTVSAVQHNDSDIQLHQMTASAIGNMPEKDLDAVKEMVIRGVMHADEHLFKFKVGTGCAAGQATPGDAFLIYSMLGCCVVETSNR